jgi:hypothetical protein
MAQKVGGQLVNGQDQPVVRDPGRRLTVPGEMGADPQFGADGRQLGNG